jgi:transcriptional regulator with XRE-family HTH domain
MSTGASIVLHRKQLHLSQEELAGKAGINLRTLQRIENNETAPRGYTLRTIAEALGVPAEALTGSTASGQEKGLTAFVAAQEQGTGLAHAMNLSALTAYLFPGLNIVAPALIWLLAGNKNAEASYYGKKVLYIQSTWSVIAILLIVPGIIGKITHTALFPVSTALWIAYLPYYLHFLIVIVTFFYIRRKKAANTMPV